jgi:hypothetical protein
MIAEWAATAMPTMKTPMGIAAKNLATSDDETLLGSRLRADCDQARGTSRRRRQSSRGDPSFGF